MATVNTFAKITPEQDVSVAPRRKIQWKNLAVGSAMNIFQVTTLGQPFEVLKTHVS